MNFSCCYIPSTGLSFSDYRLLQLLTLLPQHLFPFLIQHGKQEVLLNETAAAICSC
jgi:hypothetical protein